MKRPNEHEYFLAIAVAAASRSTCDRKSVGAVVVRDGHILSTGFNGAPAGLPHCDAAGHNLVDGHCSRAVHAEANALVIAARHGAAVAGADMYCTSSPCLNCAKLIINAGIKRVIFGETYGEIKALEWLRDAGIAAVQYLPPPLPNF
jgi:dCMP deaminase